MRKIISLLVAILATAFGASAQKATVERVEAVPFEVIPATARRVDLNGEPCALVHVEVIADDVKFEGNVIGEVEHGSGEYRVYLSPGTKMMRIKSGSFLPVFITFPDYGIKGVLPNAVYVVTLSLPQAPATTPLKTGTLSVNYEPAGAAITVDGAPYGTSPSTIANLTVGPHTVAISADGYNPATLTATIAEGRLAELTGTLTPKPDAVPASSPDYEQVNYERFEDSSTNKFGFKDENGNIVIPAKFDGVWDFSEGLATVKLNDKYGFIDKTGQLVIPTKFDDVWPFEEGLARVKLDGKCGYIDKTGKLVTPPEFDNSTWFREGLAYVKLNGKYGFIDKTGKLVIPAIFDGVSPFKEGLAVVTLKGKYGFIDKTGQLITPTKFDWAHDFSEGLAWVKLKGKYGYIDKSGTLVIPAKFDWAHSFREGLAGVKLKGKWGFIDKTGQLVIPAKFDSVLSFQNGKAKVKLNGREFYIDKQGNEVK